MSRRSRVTRLALGTLLFLVLALGLLEAKTKMVRIALDNIIYDNKSHYLSCDELPTVEAVQSVLADHNDAIVAIEQVNPGYVGFEVDTATCPGKADIIIWYGSHSDRITIEKIIQGERLFGIPYRLQNR